MIEKKHFLLLQKNPKITAMEIDATYTNLVNQVNKQMAALQDMVKQQKIAEEQERLRKIQLEMEKEKRKKEEEEQKKREEEDNRRKKHEIENRRKIEEEERRRQEAEDLKTAAALQVCFIYMKIFFFFSFFLIFIFYRLHKNIYTFTGTIRKRGNRRKSFP